VRILKLDTSGLETLLTKWHETGDLFLPAGKEAASGWQRIKPWEFTEPAEGVPKASIKTFFFPQPENLFEYSTRPGAKDAYVMRPAAKIGRARIILGVRPCDARSITLNARPYAVAPYFKARQDSTFIVGFTCERPCAVSVRGPAAPPWAPRAWTLP